MSSSWRGRNDGGQTRVTDRSHKVRKLTASFQCTILGQLTALVSLNTFLPSFLELPIESEDMLATPGR
jgi:hypothetical protein